MKKLKYIIIFILSLGIFNSCLIDDTTDLDQNDAGLNVVTFVRPVNNLTALANGDEYEFVLPINLVGPTSMDITSDIVVTFSPSAESTAIEGTHYRIDNPTITLTDATNYLGKLTITIMTEGNTPPLDDSPEFEDYVAPILMLDIGTTGDARVDGSGKGGTFTINFIPPNPYAGVYDVVMYYWHPTAGGDYPPSLTGTPYGGIRNYQKELLAITGRKCETGFAVWGDTDLCWITVSPDNSIVYEVADTWSYDVSLGDPFNSANVSHFDPATGVIYLYYNYVGSGGARIFWETFTPTF